MRLTWRNGLDSAEVAEIEELLADAEGEDGTAPVGEQVLFRLREHRDVVHQIEPVQADVEGSEHYVVRDADGTLAGYAHLDTARESAGELVAELAVHPRRRGHGVGTRLVEALLDRAELPLTAEPDTGRLRVWAHGEHPGARRLAEKFGFTRARELWQMGRELTGADLPEHNLPPQVTIRTFRPDVDDEELLRVNSRAFSWHPEQGAMDADDFRTRRQQEWFDPNGLLLAVDEGDRLLGFHWTKIHPGSLGEVYVLGVDPDAQSGGLGKALTLAGLRHLRDIGCTRVMLYVEADNGPAIKVYERLGFRRWATDVQFGR